MSFSLDTAAKTAEILGAISVVVGLLFVGFEIRGNTIAQQFTATQTLVAEYNEAITSINDSEFICIYIKGSTDFDSLSQRDKIRFSIQMQPIFRTFEQLHYSALHGTIDLNVHSGFERQFAAIMQLPGNKQFWAARHDWFGITFQEYAEKVMRESQSVQPANFALEECNYPVAV